MNTHHPILRLLMPAALLILALPLRPAGAQSPTVYDPSLGTLPTSQGWTAIDTDTSSNPSVSGGLLFQGPTSTSGVEYWQSQAPPGTAWDFTHDTLTITARLNVISSGYYNSGGLRRAGDYFFASDTQGRYFQFAIASDRVFLDRDGNAPSGGPGQALFDTTGFHDYRIVIAPSGAQAFIDGTLVTSAALGPTGATSGPGTVSFGDESILAGSQTQLSAFRFTVTPEPSPATILSLGAFGLALPALRTTRRKKHGPLSDPPREEARPCPILR